MDKEYQMIKTIEVADGNRIKIFKPCLESTAEEKNSFFKNIVKIAIRNENRTA